MSKPEKIKAILLTGYWEGEGASLNFLWHGDVPFLRGIFFNNVRNYGCKFPVFHRIMGRVPAVVI